MKSRHVLAAALVLPLVAGVTSADAAPRRKKKPKPPPPVCLLVKDAPNDATGNGTGLAETPNDPNLDILTADVASNATTLTSVIRLSAVDGTGSNSPLGRDYLVSFMAKGTVVELVASVGAAGNSWAAAKGTGTVDTAKKEVRMHVPLAALPVPVKAGDVLSQIKVTSWRSVGPGVRRIGLVDTGIAIANYPLGARSCVTVGV